MASFLRLSSSAPSVSNSLNLLSRAFASKKKAPELAVSVFKGKPRTSWQFFLNDHKDRFLDENGKYKLIEATKALSVEWKQMTEAQKKPYVERYLAENAEYQRTMNTAVTQIPPLEIAKENALRRHFDIQPLKDPRQPKRPKNAYLYFFEHVRNTSEELKKLSSTKEQAARTGEMWRALSDDEKKKYKDQAEKGHQQYVEAMKQYKKL